MRIAVRGMLLVVTEGARASRSQRGALFDAAAAAYAHGRPGYPAQVFDLLASHCGLGPGRSVLEIGAGTGQATLDLLKRGAHVTALEPGAALARVLAERTAGATVAIITAPFETASLPVARFDLVVSATAFHWVDPMIGLPRCAQVLRPGGWLALWWTIWGDPDRADPLHERLKPLLARKAPQLIQEGAAPGRYALDTEARRADIAGAGAFMPAESHLVRWTGHHTAAQTRALFATFSPWLALPEPLRTELLDDLEHIARHELADDVRRPYVTVAYLAERRV